MGKQGSQWRPRQHGSLSCNVMNKFLSRFSEFRVMWILVFFDLPTQTKKDKKVYQSFRDKLIRDGFVMFQFSIYFDTAQVEKT